MSEHPELTPKSVRAALAAASADVLASLEKGKSLPTNEILELRQTVEEAIRAYEDLIKATPAEGRADLEHSLGRQVIDLRRVVAMIPQMSSGTAVQNSEDKQADGSQPFIETRPVPKWAMPPASAPRPRGTSGLRTGDEVEAWCGPCGGLRQHNIVAMVGSEPKQVLCQSCGGRHGYRLTPARAKPAEGGLRHAGGVAYKRKKTPEEMQEERRQQELSRLRDELYAVPNVTPFDPKRRYKAGEVIDHPEYGRGKIETSLKTSIVVRFTTGRRSLILK